MADLEDRFLRRNIPGRYSQWDEDDHDEIERDGESDGEPERLPTNSGTDAAPPRHEPRPGRHNTGVKGVIADRRAHKEEEAYRRNLEQAERRDMLDRAVRGSEMGFGETSLSLSAAQDRRRRELASREDGSSDSGGESSDSDENENFMRRYRNRRLEELRAASLPPVYGEIKEVSPDEFSRAVDDSDPRTSLVVHIYEFSVPECAVLNLHLESLARSLPHTRFLRLRASVAGLSADPVGLPSVLIYRGGKLLHNLTPITESLPLPRFREKEVQELLESCGVGDNSGVCSRGDSGQHQTTLITSHEEARDYDSDDAELDEYCKDFDVPS
eukprot:CAMPEP_0183299498 /NCGR_PEP_ID=MMETSP0160_2-20130417/6221_1 /TAXON_ID=2839 ORGANISM="Odontella Sinensis, Strain Grunow 1884" /NCGR_SAMPLE_ID=MMETSP0160_2 /ASSEMBLY_ACC=CAM_ASM_000250 /LENGTH=327 /DNA_ID=CAMNT_0025461753 /DNA_START=18 /DNA_END=1001 /DNA_ORIENTATION=+